MEYFKAAIIKSDGSIDLIGNDMDELHSICLLDYAKKNGNAKIFQQLSFRHRPEIISYFLLRLYNDIIFLNTTKNIEKYGYLGVLMLPNDINDKQRNSLDNFLDSIAQYNVCLITNLELVDGMLQSDENYSLANETPKEFVNRFLKSR